MTKPMNGIVWRKPALLLAAGLGVLALGALALPYLININNYRDQIAVQLEQRLGRRVGLGALSLRVWPLLSVNVDDVRIGDDPQLAAGEFVRAKAVRLRLGWLSLLRGDPQVAGLELIQPAVTLIKTSPEKWNWSTLKPLQEPAGETDQAPPLNLRVTNGGFNLIDRTQTPPSEKTFSGVNLKLDGFAPRRAFDFELGLIVPGAQAGQLQLSGTAGPLDANDSTRTPLDAHVKLQQIELASLEALFGRQGGHAGKLTLDATLAGKLTDGLRASGQLKAEQWRFVADVEPARAPLEAKFNLTAKTAKDATGAASTGVQIEQGDLTLGKTAVSITGQVNQLPAQPSYDLQVQGERIALDSLLESAYALGFGPPAGTKASGAATVKLHATGNPQSVALQGQAEVRDLRFQSAQLPQAMQVSELRLRCEPQTISAAPFRSTLSQTTVEFNGLTVSQYGQPDKAPRAHLEIATTNAQLGDLLRIAEAFGARPNATGSGTVSLAAALDTNLGRGSRALNINGQGKLAGVRLQPAQLKQPLEIANADLAFTGDSARLDNLQAQLGASQAAGWVQIKSFAQALAAFELKANQLNVAELQTALNNSGATDKAAARQSTGNALHAEGKLSVGKLQLETLTATNVQSNVTLANQVMTLDPVTLNAFGGSYQGALRVDQAQNPPEVALNGRFGNMNINQVLSSGGQASMIHGQADGSLDVRGRGHVGDQLAQSLVGGGAIAISNGKLTGLDLMKQVEILGKFANLPTGGAGTAFRSLKTNLRFDQGRLTMDALQIVMEDLQVSGDGAMQLGAAPAINYDLLVRLSPALSKRFLPGGGEPGGPTPIRLPNVVGNFFVDQGVVALPIKVSGPLKEPSFDLNTALLQKRATAQLKESLFDQIRKKIEPPKPDAPAPDPNMPAEPKPTPKPKPADLLKDVLDKLRKKEKP